MSQFAPRIRGSAALGFLLALALLWLSLRHGAIGELVAKGAEINGGSKKGVSGVVGVADAVNTPLLVTAVSLLPLGLIVGGILMGFGSPRGGRIVGGALVMAAIVGSAGGLAS